MISLDLLRFILAMPFFIYASYSDLKERLVSTAVWFFLGIFSIALLFYQYHTLIHILAILPSIILFYEWFVEWDKRLYSYISIGVSLLLFLSALVYAILQKIYITPLLVMTILILLFRALYRIRLIKGRADARALMSITLLQPTYPRTLFSIFPLWNPKYVEIVEITFPFAFLALLYAGIFFLLFLVGMGIMNALKGDTGFPEMFMGYRLPLDEVQYHHVWLMERIVDGEHVLYLSPREHTQEDIEKLKKIGQNKVWVQPKIPFIVFITAGLFAAYLLGNFL
ncbi:MAG: peptidase A24 [Thermoplasmata archaeon]|nr:peptidase A24 [Thermoplasmata archaeon]